MPAACRPSPVHAAITPVTPEVAGWSLANALFHATAGAVAHHRPSFQDDYGILRQWQGRSSLAAYLSVVIRRLLADRRDQLLGRWDASAEARRLGGVGNGSGAFIYITWEPNVWGHLLPLRAEPGALRSP